MINDIILTVKSITFAQKAKRILERKGIKISAKRLDNSEAVNGCGWGIIIPASKHYEAIEILREFGIEYSVYEGNAN